MKNNFHTKNNFRLLTVFLALILSVTAINAQKIPAGDDAWITDPEQTYDTLDLPANAVAPGSQPYQGKVFFKGNPRDGQRYDTLIRRTSTVKAGQTTGLEVKQLSLVSVSPIRVAFADGSTQNCDVYSELSPSLASKGSMSIKSDGTFHSTLNIIPKFSFACSAGLLSKKNITNLDVGSPFVQAIMKAQSLSAKKRVDANTANAFDERNARQCETREGEGDNCGIKLAAAGVWKLQRNPVSERLYFQIQQPINEQNLLANHGVIPFDLALQHALR